MRSYCGSLVVVTALIATASGQQKWYPNKEDNPDKKIEFSTELLCEACHAVVRQVFLMSSEGDSQIGKSFAVPDVYGHMQTICNVKRPMKFMTYKHSPPNMVKACHENLRNYEDKYGSQMEDLIYQKLKPGILADAEAAVCDDICGDTEFKPPRRGMEKFPAKVADQDNGDDPLPPPPPPPSEEEMEEMRKADERGTDEEGLKFLAENGKRPEVTKLESGLQYEVLEKGAGVFRPTINSTCECHLKVAALHSPDGWYSDSTEQGKAVPFKPIEMDERQEGIKEALMLMVEGDVWNLTIPSELAYGAEGKPPEVKPSQVVQAEISLLRIHGDRMVWLPCNPQTFGDCEERDIKFIDKVENKFGGDVEAMKKEKLRLEELLQVTEGGMKVKRNKLELRMKRNLALLVRMIRIAEHNQKQKSEL